MIKVPLRCLYLPKRLLQTNLISTQQSDQRIKTQNRITNSFRTYSSKYEKYGNSRSGGSFWEPDKRGGFASKDDLTTWQHAVRGAKMVPNETKKLYNELTDYLSTDLPIEGCPQDNVVDKFFEFGNPESLERWDVSCDQDYEGGFSTANLSLMPSGTGLFSGHISTQLPKTGEIENTGYANLRYIPDLRAFGRGKYYFFGGYTHMVLRVRGDGRNYMLNLHPHVHFDLEWFNLFSYVLHTRGGPYWQETRIPFSKFFLHHKGRVQDKQFPLDTTDVKNISITLMDQNEGPYSLEVDYIGCVRDPNHKEIFAYESYQVERWTPRN
ncbi:hypothetical protein FOCC_FOCC012559 [Frankliniella occidentalis]|uniref:Complex I intermediate-associated protein 30, mitochondrial n=1 Tax=Frankliniella occidentalis TaxID=133901 RepID=A0A6J1S098_FRAOC|nr:complex I intermediate-associated protein 30, mitochondrial [Frankliniella occidentalis]KAE8741907.1 hypothetical protein FOCC_FOCC012559 [Frankliniella occidentalis]